MNEREAFKLGLYYLHHFPRPLNPKYLESGQDKYTSNKITSVIKLKLLKCINHAQIEHKRLHNHCAINMLAARFALKKLILPF